MNPKESQESTAICYVPVNHYSRCFAYFYKNSNNNEITIANQYWGVIRCRDYARCFALIMTF